ncbi:PVC-type heme-binding CxxCH protein [Gimesia fumaroli]|uniref:Cytochrome c n=1 Tax=Gimesia fumaroli TaxID=2527976 RepID=A0A518IBS0_9PLAN|nr:PVC-type heme-binding CxxCH protein [Gimesia fumaroli]QDV50479.1 Cytochrome c [Gimesia fumaroli]
MRFHYQRRFFVSLLSTTLLCGLPFQFAAAETPIQNTQDPKDIATSPQQTIKNMTVPEGFTVTLFASEPNVHQPIGFEIDDRGRVWVAECFTYERGTYDDKFEDRIIILEDTNGDGAMDRRKVFWQGSGPLTSVTVGSNGVWALCRGELRYFEDKNHDDVPDGKPQVLLEGWNYKTVRHNIVSGLTWGPDGWLYGRHGITDTSLVGTPETDPSQRTLIHCGVWRYHPVRKTIEEVSSGTTNPWGFDYDEYGQMFFTNNVNGHLWHMIPGSHYIRMNGHGSDPNPYVYELMTKCADHDHWDSSSGKWTDSRDTTGIHGKLGGGHSHCGGMIYLGDNWPQKYRNTIFLCNTHGHRVNNDALEREGSGYVGTHRPDFLLTGSDWFRGTELKYGPDGSVYLSDWADLGECHDHDGVHRTSGRIYKISYGDVTQPKKLDLNQLSDSELVKLQLHPNDWYVRHARRILMERAGTTANWSQPKAELFHIFNTSKEVPRRLRAMWALYCTNQLNDAWLVKQLNDPSEHVRIWAIRYLVDDGKVPSEAVAQFAKLARDEQSGLVRLYLASAMQSLAPEDCWEIAAALDQNHQDTEDRNFTLMLWYGIEPSVMAESDAALQFLSHSTRPLVRQLVARRLTEDIDQHPEYVKQLVQQVIDAKDSTVQEDLLTGIQAALQGRLKAQAPKNWQALKQQTEKADSKELKTLVTELSVVFGDGQTMDALKQIVVDSDQSMKSRYQALESLLNSSQDKGLLPVIQKSVYTTELQPLAFRGLSRFYDPKTIQRMLGRYRSIKQEGRQVLMDTLCSRKEYVLLLLTAIDKKQVPQGEVSAFHVRQLRNFQDKEVVDKLNQVWGLARETPEKKRAQIEGYKELLTAERLQKADRVQGRALYEKTCAKCHRLFGNGGTIGPDLTGANRTNMDYLLENMVDPSALIPKGYEMVVVALEDGRILNGTIVRQTDQQLTLQTQNEQLVLDRRQIEEMNQSKLSLMPEGQLDQLTKQQLADLIAYIAGNTQVKPPVAAATSP